MASCLAFSPTGFFTHKSSSSSTNKNQNPTSKFAWKAKEYNDKTPESESNKKETNHNRRDFLLFGILFFFLVQLILFGIRSTGIYNIATARTSVLSPDYSNCVDSSKPDGTPINCCPPPTTENITDFTPPITAATRLRTAAQSADTTNMEKYLKAIELMKRLPETDPRSFMQQANIHCAYCNGGYNQVGYPNLKFEIHQSWLFFPFHRWYLYFFEKICAKLLQDETFGLPFWNWDSPSGMRIPDMFNVTTSPLYDRRRDSDHLPPAVVDLNFDSPVSRRISPEQQMKYNLNLMYKQMVTNAKTPKLFMGQPFRPGDDITTLYGAGSVENAPHNTMHTWTGDPRESPDRENMGVFYSAARDPIFYPHHANIDRLWTIWQTKLKGKNFDSDPEWLESSFLFYDEEAKLVRVKTKDCLDLSMLKYSYQEVQTPWLQAKPKPRRKNVITSSPEIVTTTTQVVLPSSLDKVLSFIVKRPTRLRSEKEKEEAEEVLVIEEIEYDCGEVVKFDVYVNEDDVNSCTMENTEFLGSFVNVPHRHSKMAKSSMRFGITEVLEELGGEGNEVLLVSLVPRSGSVTIGGVNVEFDRSKSSA